MKRTALVLFAIIATTIFCMSDAQTKRNRHEGIGVVAHRGFWNCEEAGYAKNSIAALKCAQEAGFWGSEFDVNMTADSILLVFHDNQIDGKRIEKHRHEEFGYYRLTNGEPIPTIDQYLEQGRKHPETMLVYELKAHSCNNVEDLFIDMTIEKLKEHGLLDPSKVMFISFSHHICKRLAERLPDFDVQYLTGDKSPENLNSEGITGIDYHYNILKLNKSWIKQAKRLGMSTNVWTVNKEETLKEMIKFKVDMLTTDNPLVARDLIKQTGNKELR